MSYRHSMSRRSRQVRETDFDIEEDSHFSAPKNVVTSAHRSTTSRRNARAEHRYDDDESYTESEDESSTSRSSEESESDEDDISVESDYDQDYIEDERLENRSMYSSGGRSLAARSLQRAVHNTTNKGGSRLAIQASLALQRRKKESPKIRAKMEANALRDVNYNDGATELYKHIENKRWREAAERCRSEPLETKIWVYRMDKRNKKVMWRMLPIHTAILYRAPVYVILDLLEANPEGPMQSDDRKMLPIHMACRVMCKEDVLRVLLKHKLETVIAKDAKGRTPRDILLDDKRDQDSKVLKKVAERNKKNLLKILKEYEVIYERKYSAGSVAESRWSRFGGDRSVTSEFMDDDNGSIASRFSRGSQLRPRSRSSSVRPSSRQSDIRSSSRGRDGRSVSRDRSANEYRPISRGSASQRTRSKSLSYDSPQRNVPRPENGNRNRLPKLPSGATGSPRRPMSSSRTRRNVADDEESYMSERLSRSSRKSKFLEDTADDINSQTSGKLSRVSRAARGYDDDSAIASAVGSKHTKFSTFNAKPFPEATNRMRMGMKELKINSDYDPDFSREDVSVPSKILSDGEINEGLRDSELNDLWEDIENLYPVTVEDADSKLIADDEMKMKSNLLNRADIKYYDAPNELQKLLLVIKNDASSYNIRKSKDTANARAPLPESSTGRRVNACGALKALAKNAKNRLRLGRTKDVVPCLLTVLRDDTSTNEERARCSSTLMYLTVPKQNCEAVYLADTSILLTLNEGMLDADSRVKYNCCFILFLLSKSEDIRFEIMNDSEIMKTLTTFIDVEIDEQNIDDDVSVESNFSQRFANLGSPSGIRQQGAPENDEEVARGCRLSAMKIFLAISKVKYGGLKMMSNKSLMSNLANICGAMTADENVLCLAIFTNLSRNSENMDELFELPNLVKGINRGLSSKTAECRRCATLALQNLSCHDLFRRKIGNSQEILSGLVPQILNVDVASTDDTKHAAINTLRNLSVDPSTIPNMVGTPGLSAGLMIIAVDSSKEDAQYLACDTLAAFSHWLDTIADVCIETNEIALNGRPLASMRVSTWNQWD
eukprot:CAMPEP_0176480608 /NCGR_PEP_ID=MMETSP0200_2-20121128/2368_1 /TAXON_ID=947934 /ORGANISM="Chaetoceros sp., Strain GSL56" /LENGTH=1063 /DNA_ID=CAMNT_0017876739 /DNA_START=36 /DNA_END=3227 /DNA_ORIENTATION=+